MTDLTLPEEVMLIALDDDSGSGRGRPGLDWAIGGAVLVELALRERAEVDDDGMVTFKDLTPTGVAYLDSELAKFEKQAEAIKVKTFLHRTHRSAWSGATQELVHRGVLREEKKKILGVLPVRKFPEAEGSAETEIRKRLESVVLEGQEPDERTASLVSVLLAGRLRRAAFPEADRHAVKERMESISEGHWVQPAVRKAILKSQAAVLAAITAASASGSVG